MHESRPDMHQFQCNEVVAFLNEVARLFNEVVGYLKKSRALINHVSGFKTKQLPLMAASVH